ncbi:hypothetical protein ACLOJK_005018 [Asimina triloba]
MDLFVFGAGPHQWVAAARDPWCRLLRRWATTCCLRFGLLAGSGPLTKMGAMVDVAADRTWKMHGRGLLLGRSLHGVIGSAGASAGVVGRGLISPENGLRRLSSEEDGVPLYGTPTGYGNLVHTH